MKNFPFRNIGAGRGHLSMGRGCDVGLSGLDAALKTGLGRAALGDNER